MTEIIEGPIAAVDRVYAFDRIRAILRGSRRAIRRVRARLTTQPNPTGDGRAIAECWLLLEGELIVCAGVAASSVRDAVDALAARLEQRLHNVDDKPSPQRIQISPAEVDLAGLADERSSGVGACTRRIRHATI